MRVVDYPLEQFDLRPWARRTLGVEKLEALHQAPDPVPFVDFVARLNWYRELLVEGFGEARETYLALVDHVAALFGEIDLSQPTPSFRCHLVGGRTASAFHRDGDAKYGIRPGTVNAWVPLTKVYGSNSLQVESRPGAGDFQPFTLEPGQLILFDAYHLAHGSVRNETVSTRISFDFRFLPSDPNAASRLGISASAP